MDKQTQGAWLLHHAKNLEAVQGDGPAQLENITHAGKVGRFLNVLFRDDRDEPQVLVSKERVEALAKLNGIDRATRTEALRDLSGRGLVEQSTDGSISLLGVTSHKVLEVTADVFASTEPKSHEQAILVLSDTVSTRPTDRAEATEFLSDQYKMTRARVTSLVDLGIKTGLVDVERDGTQQVLFNGHNFRHRGRVLHAKRLFSALGDTDATNVRELEGLLRQRGTLEADRAATILGDDLLRRLNQIGYLDRMEVSNKAESIGYVALPDAFQRYGRPFEEDPVDDAKALLASLTYGIERSPAHRGRLTVADRLLAKLVAGEWVGPATAIGEDYRVLERRGVIRLRGEGGGSRFYMKLLKRDVGRLALAILQGASAASEVALMSFGVATGFVDPHESRMQARGKKRVGDDAFAWEAFQALRTGGAA